MIPERKRDFWKFLRNRSYPRFSFCHHREDRKSSMTWGKQLDYFFKLLIRAAQQTLRRLPLPYIGEYSTPSNLQIFSASSAASIPSTTSPSSFPSTDNPLKALLSIIVGLLPKYPKGSPIMRTPSGERKQWSYCSNWITASSLDFIVSSLSAYPISKNDFTLHSIIPFHSRGTEKADVYNL